MTVATPVRRGSVTVADCDRELKLIADTLATLPEPALPHSRLAEVRERLFLDADRWLDLRHEIETETRRIAAQGPRGLG